MAQRTGWRAREFKGKWYLEHDGILVHSSSATADQQTVERWAGALTDSDAFAARVAEADAKLAVGTMVTHTPTGLTARVCGHRSNEFGSFVDVRSEQGSGFTWDIKNVRPV